MNDRPAMTLTGMPASRGYAAGPLAAIEAKADAYQRKGSASSEAAALRAALSTASEAVATLIAASDEEAAAILEFQLAMLEDDALSAPALARIEGGEPADGAWRAALDAEIAGYAASDDDYFRARAADLADIRDRVLRALTGGDEAQTPAGAILYGRDIAPTRFLATDWSKGGGVALAAGSTASHVAMLARSRGVPMVVGLGAALDGASGPALLDAEAGTLTLRPKAESRDAFHAKAQAYAERAAAAAGHLLRPATTADGAPVVVKVNIADPAETAGIDIAACDGVGLMRTEFLFGGVRGLPDEQTQFAAYRAVLAWASGKPVTIRTVDAGGDKPVAGYTVEESNPFLGLRGIRLSLARPEIFRVQVRALLRAATEGDLKVMFPMVAVPGEFDAARRLFEDEAARLQAEGVAHRMPPLGIMVEVPSVAVAPELFPDPAFLSIGSNDLTQYVMAAARDNPDVAALNDVHHPAVLRLIANVAAHGLATGVPVSLCGDAGGDPAAIPALLRAGIREVSVAPAGLAFAKAAIAATRL